MGFKPNTGKPATYGMQVVNSENLDVCQEEKRARNSPLEGKGHLWSLLLTRKIWKPKQEGAVGSFPSSQGSTLFVRLKAPQSRGTPPKHHLSGLGRAGICTGYHAPLEALSALRPCCLVK